MSEALKNLQEKCGCAVVDGVFGPNTARHIADHYKLSPLRGAHLLGQSAHESAGFKLTEENLNYSVKAMMRVWPSRFPTEASAEPYARNPKALADKVYGSRMQNQGQGYKWRGRGFLQLTGAMNYKAFAKDMKADEVLDDPDCVADEYALDTAIWYFDVNGLWHYCDKGITDEVIKQITKKINGGYHGLDDRINQTKKIFAWLSV